MGVALVAALAVSGLGDRRNTSTAAAAELHHAAVVIDTADGKVRKFCLAFPEAAISGAEALRRVESEVVFASYGPRGQAVCSLCGVGCPAGDCFCDRSKYWAYHRAGPGGAPYAFSRAGVSSTEVRDGDVEGWRWGTGDAPPAATVGEVCGVPEPPARTGSAAGATTTTTTPAPTTTEANPVESAAPGATPTTVPTAPAPADRAPGGTLTTVASPQPPPLRAEASPAPDADGAGAPAPTTPTTDADDGDGARRVAGAATRAPGGAAAGPGALDVLSGVGFVAVLGGVLVWRARLRRADVRAVTPVR